MSCIDTYLFTKNKGKDTMTHKVDRETVRLYGSYFLFLLSLSLFSNQTSEPNPLL